MLIPHCSHVVQGPLDDRVVVAIPVMHRVEEDRMQGKHIIPIIWIEDLAVAAHAVEAVAKLVSHLLACVAPTTLHARIVN